MMYEELFEELKSKKNELSKEEYIECYNSIKEAKLSSDYLNSNNNTCTCGGIIVDIRYIPVILIIYSVVRMGIL